MYLGIEIGGTKLQFGVGSGDGGPVDLQKFTVDRAAGARGILDRIETAAEERLRRFPCSAIGIGFGGPVDAAAGRVLKSHQIDGWDDFPLVEWCRERFGLSCALGNDADLAALAEARFGAGRGCDPVFYVTVGTGIGGGFVRGGRLYQGHGPAVAEIGHLRPGLDAAGPDETVESIASGLAIERAAEPLRAAPPYRSVTGERLTPREVAAAAAAGHVPSQRILDRAVTALGWAIAQTVTLLAPQVVVVGGGVSLLGEESFYAPLRRTVDRFVFPPLRETFRVSAPALGETMVVRGALALARDVVAGQA